MHILDLLSKYPDLAALLVGTLVGIFRHKSKTAAANDLWETLQDLAMQAFPALMKNPTEAYKTARAEITKHVWDGLDRLKLPRNKATEILVNEVVEWALARLAEKIWQRSFETIEGKLGKTLESIDSLPPDVAIGDSTKVPA